MLIGLTGGIGSGKSLAGDFFKSKNIDVIDADDLAHNALDRKGEGYKKFLDVFGETFLDENSEIDRKALRKYIFQNPEMKNKLEEIVHPIVQNGILNFINNSNSIYRIIIVPLIAETNSSSFYDRVLVIDCKKEIQIERASKRDNSNEEQILKIIQSQASAEERNKIANDVILNNGTKEDFIENLESIHKKYLTLRL
tara:strand:+ start:938 stop:1528 length:591 start_codon:yes stop_codon:yes gene_type:complete